MQTPHSETTATGPDPVDQYVGVTIRARRKALGLSQETLAEACGITFQQIQKYEKAANRVSASMLVRLAKALKCHPGDFFPADGDNPFAPAAPASSWIDNARSLNDRRPGLLARMERLDTPHLANLDNIVKAIIHPVQTALEIVGTEAPMGSIDEAALETAHACGMEAA